MGAPPPPRIAPMDTCTEERRLMLMGMYGANSTVATLGRHSRGLLSYVSPNRSVRRESGASRNAEGANSARKRSGTGTADGGRRRVAEALRLPPFLFGWRSPAALSAAMRLQERFCGKTDPAFRDAPGAGRAHRRLRRLGHAGAVQLADRRAPRGAPRRRRVRRVAHVRRGPAWRARARVAAAPAGKRRSEAPDARQGALRLHAERARRGDRRHHRLLPLRLLVPRRGEPGVGEVVDDGVVD